MAGRSRAAAARMRPTRHHAIEAAAGSHAPTRLRGEIQHPATRQWACDIRYAARHCAVCSKVLKRSVGRCLAADVRVPFPEIKGDCGALVPPVTRNARDLSSFGKRCRRSSAPGQVVHLGGNGP